MFDSNIPKSANFSRALVAMTLKDGSSVNVSVKLTMTNRIADVLNGADQFLDIVTAEGGQMFVAKSDVRNVRLLDVPKANQLNLQRRSSDRAAFDPYAVLKLPRSATPDDVKAAYHKLTRLYHPDRIGALEVPDEMLEYARAMQVRINLAYEQIGR